MSGGASKSHNMVGVLCASTGTDAWRIDRGATEECPALWRREASRPGAAQRLGLEMKKPRYREAHEGEEATPHLRNS
jgi:hypothetical protein